MRLILFFDLPTETNQDIKNYTKFRKNLIKLGFLMMQYSVYVKMVNVQSKIERELDKVKKIIPQHGKVNVLHVTDHQYQKMERLVGTKSEVEEYNDNRRLVFI